MLRRPRLPARTPDIPAHLISLVDDCERRLARAPEGPRRLQTMTDYGARTLYTRFPR